MLKKLMNKKKNNKGFSLVELIVVVLIIAIIAVALAPQVMKWVGTSKTNVDQNNAATFKAAANAGVADYMATKNTATCPIITDLVFTTATKPTVTGTEVIALIDYIDTAVNSQWPTSQANASGFRLNITSAGGVTVEYNNGTTWVKAK